MELPESASSKTIYVTVRCINKAGLVATGSSDGVSIVRDRQTSESLVIETFGHSPSHYPVFSNFHGTAEQFRIRLSGFAGDHQIKKYKVCLFVLSPDHDHDNGWDISATPVSLAHRIGYLRFYPGIENLILPMQYYPGCNLRITYMGTHANGRQMTSLLR